jgi:hypothetical protein
MRRPAPNFYANVTDARTDVATTPTPQQPPTPRLKVCTETPGREGRVILSICPQEITTTHLVHESEEFTWRPVDCVSRSFQFGLGGSVAQSADHIVRFQRVQLEVLGHLFLLLSELSLGKPAIIKYVDSAAASRLGRDSGLQGERCPRERGWRVGEVRECRHGRDERGGLRVVSSSHARHARPLFTCH